MVDTVLFFDRILAYSSAATMAPARMGEKLCSQTPYSNYTSRHQRAAKAIIFLLVSQLLFGCAREKPKIESYDSLTQVSQTRVQTAVLRYVECSIRAVLILDKGRRHIGRLAWTASESCIAEKNNVVRTMVGEGTSNEAAFSYASDMQVQATAAAITAAQNKRSQQ